MKCLAILVLTLSTAFCEDSKPVVEIQKVFKVVTRKDWSRQWTATAFFISPNRLLTAAHTFKESNNQWIVKGGKEVQCTLVKIDFKKDIAILECSDPCESFYRLVSKITLIGFPGQKPLAQYEGKIDSKRIHARVYFVNGMSGCPMVNEYGDVEAMCVQGDIGGDDYDCRAIPAGDLAEFVKSEK